MQHLYNSWHATIGSTAITVVNCVYESSRDEFPTDEDRQEFAKQQLEDREFLYGKVDSKV